MAFSLTWLPDVLRNAGLKVAFVDGWQTRGRGEMGTVKGVLLHHTAGSRTGNMPSLGTLIHGRSDLPGPLAQLGLGRDGTYYVVAAGRCNHAGGGLWQGISSGNSSFIGIEAENTGSTKDFPWPAVQMEAYQRGVAAILAHIGRGPEFCAAHREYALPKGRKPDPIFDMGAFRAAVAAILNNTAPPLTLIPAAEPGGAGRPTLRRGMNTPLVATVQQALGVQPASGNFGPKTEAAVRALQRDHDMVADGIVGPKTWALLDRLAAPSPPSAPAPAPPVTAPLPIIPAAPGDAPPVAGMDLAAAHRVLGHVTTSIPTSEWDKDLTLGVQRALAELYLLSPYDGVDGDFGPRTGLAWALFRAGVQQGSPNAIDADGAQALIQHSGSRFGLIGTPAVKLQPDFEFRRNKRTDNRERSAAAIIRAATAQGLTKAQIAYVLATAEHESDRFAVLEEYATGAAYEGRVSSLGNTQQGDGRRFKGRGYVQLTGRRNYTAYANRSGLKLLDFPVILQNWPALSVWVIVDGMTRGAYTGRRLDQFVNAGRQDFKEARRVVNGQDQADKIAQQARDWLSRL